MKTFQMKSQFFQNILFSPATEKQWYLHLKSVWSEINLPVAENEVVCKFFARIYYSDGCGKNARL